MLGLSFVGSDHACTLISADHLAPHLDFKNWASIFGLIEDRFGSSIAQNDRLPCANRVNHGKKLLEENNNYPDVKTSLSSSSLIDNGGLDYVDDYEDDDDDNDKENGDTGKD
ncbi:hypothetical protein Dsin_000595 [Dipteronia sinensis]|uniref:Uncharacterized protein n=1 Tax=Dipteronia sinensis TaxID=43782 RepID=A0AAE0EHX8_9ROSI|nr:hypothetical protein Dsin_000595 [Dipteronia sinensis]